MIATLIYASLYAVVGGYVTGRIARSCPMAAVTIMAGIAFILSFANLIRRKRSATLVEDCVSDAFDSLHTRRWLACDSRANPKPALSLSPKQIAEGWERYWHVVRHQARPGNIMYQFGSYLATGGVRRAEVRDGLDSLQLLEPPLNSRWPFRRNRSRSHRPDPCPLRA
jgi:hypothetical protein